MATYEYPDHGALFINDRKETENQPDFTGTAVIGGEEFYVSMWKKTSAVKGTKFFSLSFKKKGFIPEDGAEAQEGDPYDL